MKNSILKYLVLFQLPLLFLASCMVDNSQSCFVIESSPPKAYEFGDDTYEMNYTKLTPCVKNNGIDFYRFLTTERIKAIKSKSFCDSIIDKYDSSCNVCNGIDFNKNMILYLDGYFKDKIQMHSERFDLNVSVNPKTQIFSVELRGYYVVCGSDPYVTIDYHELLLLPKLPDNYTLNINKIGPVREY